MDSGDEIPASGNVSPPQEGAAKPKQVKQKPSKPLPSDRLSFDSQLSILRAYAAASGPSKNPASNADVEKISDISASSVSVCNPFFNDVGLIIREGNKQRPAQNVFDYAHSFEWDAEGAAAKLAPIIEDTWFAEALIPKLAFRALSRDEAVTYLAEESKATLEYKRQLELLLDYLEAAGLIKIEGNTVTKAPLKQHRAPHYPEKPQEQAPGQERPALNDDRDKIVIPIPGKKDVEVFIPNNLDVDDWAMFYTVLRIYIKRLKKWNDPEINSAVEEIQADM